MIPLQQRTAADGVRVHSELPARVYEGDAHQSDRIRIAREYVAQCPSTSIVEIGCGTGDISGPFAEERVVVGYDCNPTAIAEAKRRFPRGLFHDRDVTELKTVSAGTVVLCEFLEHISDPVEMVRTLLPQFEYSVISHPLDEIELVRQGVNLSGGEHAWSFDSRDFREWFEVGGHELVHSEVFRMGGYTIIIGRGKRKTQ